MKLSIITVCLNDLAGLKKTHDSVISQQYNDFEWIVIDGGSTDGGREFIEQHADNISYWCSEHDNGIYNAMNKGIRVAKGEYVLFLNSGDWLVNSHSIENVFKENHDEDILFGTEYSVDPYVGTYEYGFKSTDFSAFELLSKPLPHQATFTKKHLFDTIGLFNENYKIVADLEFSYRAIVLNNASVCYIDQIIAYFDGNGISNTKPQLVQEEIDCIAQTYLPARVYKDFQKHNEVILSYGIIEQCKIESANNREAIHIYNSLSRKNLGRIAIALLLKLSMLKKKIK